MHPSKLLRATLVAGALAGVGVAAGIAGAAAAPTSTTQSTTTPAQSTTTPTQSTTPQSTTPKPTTPKSTTPKSNAPSGHHCPHMGSGSSGSTYTGPESGPEYSGAGVNTASEPAPAVSYQ